MCTARLQVGYVMPTQHARHACQEGAWAGSVSVHRQEGHTWAARTGNEVDFGALAGIILQALRQAGAAGHVAQQQRAKIHADGVLQGNVVVLRHGNVMEESKPSTLHT